jgi:hypothetical protein
MTMSSASSSNPIAVTLLLTSIKRHAASIASSGVEVRCTRSTPNSVDLRSHFIVNGDANPDGSSTRYFYSGLGSGIGSDSPKAAGGRANGRPAIRRRLILMKPRIYPKWSRVRTGPELCSIWCEFEWLLPRMMTAGHLKEIHNLHVRRWINDRLVSWPHRFGTGGDFSGVAARIPRHQSNLGIPRIRARPDDDRRSPWHDPIPREGNPASVGYTPPARRANLLADGQDDALLHAFTASRNVATSSGLNTVGSFVDCRLVGISVSTIHARPRVTV